MTRKKPPSLPVVHDRELIEIARLTPHPRNYREHPEDQLVHLAQSMREHGVYRNVVIANDDVILAGHGVVEAAKLVNLETIPVVRLPIPSDDPKALKLVAADNELGRFAISDDRVLSDLLAEIREHDLDGLLGTGYDDAMLANLLFVTRPASEIADMDTAAHWVGMPDFQRSDTADAVRLTIHFDTEADREAFMELIGTTVVHHTEGSVKSLWWPNRERHDLTSLRFAADGEPEP